MRVWKIQCEFECECGKFSVSLSVEIETLIKLTPNTLTPHTLAEFQCERGKISVSVKCECGKISLSLSASPEIEKFSLSLSVEIETLIKLTPNTLTLHTRAEFQCEFECKCGDQKFYFMLTFTLTLHTQNCISTGEQTNVESFDG